MSEQQIPAGKFKTHCLQLMDQVAQSRTAVTITKHGKPLARLVPLDHTPKPIFGVLSGSAHIHGDLVTPIDETWDVDR